MLSNIRIGKAAFEGQRAIEVRGKVDEEVRAEDDGRRALHFFAASPPDLRSGPSAQNMPFASFEQAFHATPNVGSVQLNGDNEFVVRFHESEEPNAYYVGLGSQYIPPTLHVWYVKGGDDLRLRQDASIKLNDGVPFRMLTYPTLPTRPRDGATFYTAAPTFARSQEQIIRESEYPAPGVRTMPPNFWGLKPPV